MGNLSGQRVLDVGCGTGWLSEVLYSHGASEVWGIDPAQRNVDLAQATYPTLQVSKTTLKDFETDAVFDAAMALMVFEHIQDLHQGFIKLVSLVREDGLLFAMVADSNVLAKPRFGYEVSVASLGDGEAVVRTMRPEGFGTTYDIARPVGNYVRTAHQTGWHLNVAVPLVPTPNLLAIRPQYQEHGNEPICHLLIFRGRHPPH